MSTTNVSFHNVVKIIVGEPRGYRTPGLDGSCQHITLVNADGNELQISAHLVESFDGLIPVIEALPAREVPA